MYTYVYIYIYIVQYVCTIVHMITIDCMYIQETCQYVRKHTSTHTQMSQMRQKTGEEMVFLWLNMSGWWFQPL